MTRTYAKPGDIVRCPLVRHDVIISKVWSQDYYGPASGDGWQLEFVDTDDEYRAWKQRCDGGELIQLGTEANPYKDYMTHDEIKLKIADAMAENDEDLMQVYNDILDDLLYALDCGNKDDIYVMTLCGCCEEWKPVRLNDLLQCTFWSCLDCDQEVDDWLGMDPEDDERAAMQRLDPGLKRTRCDEEDCYCPYDSSGPDACRNHCGVGVDE